jgi:hypothetical protein
VGKANIKKHGTRWRINNPEKSLLYYALVYIHGRLDFPFFKTKCSVADPDPGSGVFSPLDQGSGMGKKSRFGIRMLDEYLDHIDESV